MSLVSDVLVVMLVAQVFHDLECCWSIEVGWVLLIFEKYCFYFYFSVLFQSCLDLVFFFPVISFFFFCSLCSSTSINLWLADSFGMKYNGS